MVPEPVARKILDRIAVAKRLGGNYHAEAAGLLRRLCGQEMASAIYQHPEHKLAYERGYREADEILKVETSLARTA